MPSLKFRSRASLGLALGGLTLAAGLACSARVGRHPVGAHERQAERVILAHSVRVPIQRAVSGHLGVVARVGERDVSLILDTGATISVLSKQVIDGLSDAPDGDGRVRALGANGSLGQVRVVTIDGLSLGGVPFPHLEFAELDLGVLEAGGATLDGLLGRNWFDRSVVALDLRGQTLSLLTDADLQARVERGDLIGLGVSELRSRLLRLDVLIDARGPAGAWMHDPMALPPAHAAIPAVLDLGASHTILNSAGALALGIDPSRRADRRIELIGTDGRALRAPTLRVRGLAMVDEPRTGVARAVEGASVAIADPEILDALGMRDRPCLVLGLDMFRDATLILDLGRKRLWVSPVFPGPIATSPGPAFAALTALTAGLLTSG